MRQVPVLVCSLGANNQYLEIQNSLISSNISSLNGGGICSAYADIIISNSTITGNKALSLGSSAKGGGLYISYHTGFKIHFSHVTIANNSVEALTSSSGAQGGGIYIVDSSEDFIICDEEIDEDFASEITTCGVGACVSTGSTSCVGGATVDSCVALEPGIEICDNGTDDDCDGSADETEDCPVAGSDTSSDSTTGATSITGEETTSGDSSSTGEGSGSAENGTTDGTTENSTTGEESSSSSSTSSEGSSSSTGSDTSDITGTTTGTTDTGNPNEPIPPPADGSAAEGSSGCSLKV